MTTFSTPVRSTPQLSAALRDARKASRLTQSQLAERTHIPRSWISRMENGKIHDPSFKKLFNIFRELGITTILQYPFTEPSSKAKNSNVGTANESVQHIESAEEKTVLPKEEQEQSPLTEMTLSALAAGAQKKTEAFLEQTAKRATMSTGQDSL